MIVTGVVVGQCWSGENSVVDRAAVSLVFIIAFETIKSFLFSRLLALHYVPPRRDVKRSRSPAEREAKSRYSLRRWWTGESRIPIRGKTKIMHGKNPFIEKRLSRCIIRRKFACMIDGDARGIEIPRSVRRADAGASCAGVGRSIREPASGAKSDWAGLRRAPLDGLNVGRRAAATRSHAAATTSATARLRGLKA